LDAVDFGMLSARAISDSENGCCGWLSSSVSTSIARSMAGASDLALLPDRAGGFDAALVLCAPCMSIPFQLCGLRETTRAVQPQFSILNIIQKLDNL
jgi:hypothetical protein